MIFKFDLINQSQKLLSAVTTAVGAAGLENRKFPGQRQMNGNPNSEDRRDNTIHFSVMR